MKNHSLWLFCLLASTMQALPTDLQIAAGKADLTLSSPETLEILASDQAILNWKDFSIDANERVHFIQPDTSSCVLNRVLGSDPSRLLGSMHANGKVLLLNPNGILVGRDAYLDPGVAKFSFGRARAISMSNRITIRLSAMRALFHSSRSQWFALAPCALLALEEFKRLMAIS